MLSSRLCEGDVDLDPDATSSSNSGRAECSPLVRACRRCRLLGDSLRQRFRVGLIAFSLGSASYSAWCDPFPAPGDRTFRLGIAGGPLISASCWPHRPRGPLVCPPVRRNLTCAARARTFPRRVACGGQVLGGTFRREVRPFVRGARQVVAASLSLYLAITAKSRNA